MMTPKDQLKELGAALRASGSGHQAMLRARLEVRARDLKVENARGRWKVWLLAFPTLAVVMVVVATQKDTLIMQQTPMAYPDTVLTERQADNAPQAVAELGGRGADSFLGSRAQREESEPLMLVDDLGLSAYALTGEAIKSSADIADYKDGDETLLDTTTTISLWSTDNLVTPVQTLFTSIGGHISSISQYSFYQPTTFTGLVPADSYFLFRDQLHEMVGSEKYFAETLNAQDLTPSALVLDEQMTDTQTAIENLQAEIDKAKNESTKADLKQQLEHRETQLENLQAARDDVDEEVSYVKVSVTVREIPSFWETNDAYDLKNLVAGQDGISVFQQGFINILMAGFVAVQILSVTFWLFIPLTIWLIYRRRQRKMWKELA